MKSYHYTTIILLSRILILNIFSYQYKIVNIWAVYQYDQAPYSIIVELENVTINLGKDIVLLIGIQTEEGFNSTVELDLEISFVGYNLSIKLFPLYPLFLRMQKATIEVPPRAHAGKANGFLRATYEDYIVIKDIEIILFEVE